MIFSAFISIIYYRNIMGDNFFLNFEISALIYNFICEITNWPWQRFLCLGAKMAARFKNVVNEDVRALKDD